MARVDDIERVSNCTIIAAATAQTVLKNLKSQTVFAIGYGKYAINIVIVIVRKWQNILFLSL